MRDHDDPETIRIAERKGSPHGGDTSDTLHGRPVVESPRNAVPPHAGDDRRMTDRIKSMASRWTLAVPVLAVVLLALTWEGTCPAGSSGW